MKKLMIMLAVSMFAGTASAQIWSESFSANAPPTLNEDSSAQITNEYTTGQWTTAGGRAEIQDNSTLRIGVNEWSDQKGMTLGTSIALDDSLFVAAGNYRLTLDIYAMQANAKLGVRIYDASIGSGGTNNYYSINNYQWGVGVPAKVVPTGDATTNLLAEAYLNASHIGTRSVDFSYDGSGDVVVMLMAMSDTEASSRWIVIDEISVDAATVNSDVPSFTSATNSIAPAADENVSYSNTTFLASVTSNPGAEALIYSAETSGAPGLSVSTNGTIYGTPTLGGTNTLLISVADAEGASDDAVFMLVVNNVNDAPVFSTAYGNNEFWARAALANLPYDADLNNYMWDEEGDELTFSGSGPAWLNIGSDGALSGSPGADDYGKNTFEIIANDGTDSSTGTLYIAVQKKTIVQQENFSATSITTANPAVFPSPQLVTSTYTNGTWYKGGTFVLDGGTVKFGRPGSNGGLSASAIVFAGALFADGAGTYTLSFDIVNAGQTVKTYVELHDLDMSTGTVTVPTYKWDRAFEDPDGTLPDVTSAGGATNVLITNVTYAAATLGTQTIEFEYDGSGDVLLRIGAGRNGNNSWWTNHKIDDLLIVGSSVATPYEVWREEHGLAGGPTDDDDSDGLSNVYEYGLGLDPTNTVDPDAVADGALPTFGAGASGFDYVHAQHSYDETLVYSLEQTDDLVDGTWVSASFAVSGTDVTGGTYDYVTNSIPTDDDQTFIRLIVEEQ